MRSVLPVEDDVGFLREIRRCVMPEGRIYLSVPAHPWLWSVEDDHAGHHRRYDTASLRAALSSAGLRVEYLSYIFTLLPLPMFLLRRVPSVLGLSRSEPADRVEGHLQLESALAASALGLVARFEAWWVAGRRRFPFGASLLVAARNAP